MNTPTCGDGGLDSQGLLVPEHERTSPQVIAGKDPVFFLHQI